MIQRPQTLFYLAIIAICIMLIFSDTVYFTAENTATNQSVSVEYDETKMMAANETDTEPNTYLIAIAAGIALLSLVALLMFKNRKFQILLSSVNYLLILGLIIMMYLYSMKINYFNGTGNQTYTFAALLPMALLFLNFLAAKGVKKDEKLIRSMDRLR